MNQALRLAERKSNPTSIAVVVVTNTFLFEYQPPLYSLK